MSVVWPWSPKTTIGGPVRPSNISVTPAFSVSVTFWTKVGARPPTCTPSVLKWIGTGVRDRQVVEDVGVVDDQDLVVPVAGEDRADGTVPSAIADISSG